MAVAVVQTVIAIALSLVAYRLVDQAVELNRVQDTIRAEQRRADMASRERDLIDMRLDLLAAVLAARGQKIEDLTLPPLRGTAVTPSASPPAAPVTGGVTRPEAQVAPTRRAAPRPAQRPSVQPSPRPSRRPVVVVPTPAPRPTPTTIRPLPLLSPLPLVCNLDKRLCPS
jgi:hypothetical protein